MLELDHVAIADGDQGGGRNAPGSRQHSALWCTRRSARGCPGCSCSVHAATLVTTVPVARTAVITPQRCWTPPRWRRSRPLRFRQVSALRTPTSAKARAPQAASIGGSDDRIAAVPWLPLGGVVGLFDDQADASAAASTIPGETVRWLSWPPELRDVSSGTVFRWLIAAAAAGFVRRRLRPAIHWPMPGPKRAAKRGRVVESAHRFW